MTPNRLAPNPRLADYLSRSGLYDPSHGVLEKFLRGAACRLAIAEWECDAEEGVVDRLTAGREILSVAPPATMEAVVFASYLAARVSVANELPLASVLSRAFSEEFPRNDGSWATMSDWAYEFGWYIAAEALGDGVSWADDHAYHPTKVPDIDVSCNPGGRTYVAPSPDLGRGLARILSDARRRPDSLLSGASWLTPEAHPELPGRYRIKDDKGNVAQVKETRARVYELSWTEDGQVARKELPGLDTKVEVSCGEFFWDDVPHVE